MAREDSFKKLREQLVRRRDALDRTVEGQQQVLGEDKSIGDVLDEAASGVADELNSTLLEAESREHGAIVAALQRYERGEYGDCLDCGKAIPLERLRAIPYATDCIDCRRKAETRQGNVTWNRVFDTFVEGE